MRAAGGEATPASTSKQRHEREMGSPLRALQKWRQRVVLTRENARALKSSGKKGDQKKVGMLIRFANARVKALEEVVGTNAAANEVESGSEVKEAVPESGGGAETKTASEAKRPSNRAVSRSGSSSGSGDDMFDMFDGAGAAGSSSAASGTSAEKDIGSTEDADTDGIQAMEYGNDDGWQGKSPRDLLAERLRAEGLPAATFRKAKHSRKPAHQRATCTLRLPGKSSNAGTKSTKKGGGRLQSLSIDVSHPDVRVDRVVVVGVC
jgi:hypothetical protein